MIVIPRAFVFVRSSEMSMLLGAPPLPNAPMLSLILLDALLVSGGLPMVETPELDSISVKKTVTK